eukprot:TRINITY_DN3503_c0_g1_i1.p1 TRINITY_DN3503_c0_g1~~TRINITY_DN3503_c0_g1_i1.p1  ORF type:complete len:146 (+),score=8.80 TRINITY_DN3503_c0_g1_i1:430-867(+)
MSRTGDKRELLLGPLSYGLIFIISTIAYWRTSLQGVTALILLCAGDGSAGLFGELWGGKYPLPHNQKKSWIGTLAFIFFAFMGSAIYVWIFTQCGFIYHLSMVKFLPHLFIIVLVAAFVESLPLSEWDNITVFFSSIVMYWLLGY